MADNEAVPGKPTLAVGKVTHQSIELIWKRPPHEGPLTFYLQEEGNQRQAGFTDAYSGSSERKIITDLTPSTSYSYRVKATNAIGSGPWSPVVTVETSDPPKTCDELHKAVQRGNRELIQRILEESPHYVDVPDGMGCSALMTACRSGNKSIVEQLLDLGADVEWCTTDGKTSLMESCYHGKLDCVEVLIGRGASWRTEDRIGLAAVHWAVDGGQVGLLNYAIAEGVQVDVPDKNGWTPLMRVATVTGDETMAQVLIENGADVNRRDNNGNTVLMLAALSGFDAVVTVLLENGVDVQAKNKHGKTAFDFAESFNKLVVMELLKEADPSLDSP